MRQLLSIFAAAAFIAGAAAPAEAVLLNYSLTGDYEASWQLDSNPDPDDFASDVGFVLWDVEGNFPGSLFDVADLYFYADDIGGGLGIEDFYGGTTLLLTDGSQLYTGPEVTPTLRTGIFALTEFGGPGTYTLSVTEVGTTAVPEAATWALMLTGFGLAGYALRRRGSRRIAQAA